ncbi:MAG TPA: MFS transporter [Spirochaetia bacterium]|nr:MFS transporter [Spirochaetia bacterium]
MISTLDRSTRRLYVLFLLGFATFGVIFTIIGAALPQIIRTFQWSYTLTGAVLAMSAVGYFVSTFVCGILTQRLPPKWILSTGLFLGAVAMSLFVRWPSPWLNLVLNFCIGLCQGAVEVVTNLEVIHMEKRGQSRLMNLMHSAFCVGGIVGPAAVGYFLGTGAGGRVAFAAAAGLLALMALLFGTFRFPAIRQAEARRDSHGARVMLQPLVILVTLLLLLYVGAELGVSTWISEYFVRVHGTAASMGAFAVSIFWIGLLAGRLTLSVAYQGSRQEYIVLGLALLSAAALGVILLVTSTSAVAFGVFLTGLGFSGIYPLLLVVVGRYHRSGMAVGTVTTGGGVGSFTFPFLMAVLAQRLGMRGGFWFYLGLSCVIAMLSVVLIAAVRRRSAAS